MFPLSKQARGLFWKEKINSFWTEKKEILSCLKENSDGFSLEEQYFVVYETKVGGLNLMMTRTFSRELIIASLFDPT